MTRGTFHSARHPRIGFRRDHKSCSRHFCLTCLRFCLPGLLFLTFQSSGIRASDNYPAGAAPLSMSGVAVMQSGFWSMWHNQAGLAGTVSIACGIHHENRFMVKELALTALGITLPTSSGTFGISLTRFGYSRYHEDKIGLAFGRAFTERFSAGLQLDYFNRFTGPLQGKGGTAEAGSEGSLSVELGVQAEILQDLRLGVHLFNPTASLVPGSARIGLPSLIRIGLGYRFDRKLFMGIETLHSLEHSSPAFRVGLEYSLIDYIYIRSGLSVQDYVQHSFGLGFLRKNLRADLAFSFQQPGGYTPSLSLLYVFR